MEDFNSITSNGTVWPRLAACATCCLVLVMLIAGCSSSDLPIGGGDPTPDGAIGSGMISAKPNPVPAGPGDGTTIISWDSGDDTEAQVYVSANNGPEELFAWNSKGSKSATWIQAGVAYEFRLYAGAEHKKVLAAVTVKRNAN